MDSTPADARMYEEKVIALLADTSVVKLDVVHRQALEETLTKEDTVKDVNASLHQARAE